MCKKVYLPSPLTQGDEITIDEENAVLREHLYLTQSLIKEKLTRVITKTSSARARIDERLKNLTRTIDRIEQS